MHTETTAGSSGSTLRATMDCSWLIICAPTRIVSTARCGRAAWPPLAVNLDLQVVGGSHYWTWPRRKLPNRQAGKIVHAKDFLDAETRDQSVLDHGERAGAALLRRLENDDRSARKIARLGEIFGGAEQHGHMAVMAAGMHFAGNGRFVRQAGFFLQRQRIHIGAQPDHLVAGFAPANDAHHPGPPDAGNDFVAAEALELFGHRTGGAMHIEAQFRMGMEIPPPLLDLVVQVSDAVDDRHWGVPVSECVCGTRPQCSKARTKKRAGAAGFRALSISFKPRGPARCGRRHLRLAQSAWSPHKKARYQRIRARSSVGRARDF